MSLKEVEEWENKTKKRENKEDDTEQISEKATFGAQLKHVSPQINQDEIFESKLKLLEKIKYSHYNIKSNNKVMIFDNHTQILNSECKMPELFITKNKVEVEPKAFSGLLSVEKYVKK
jgi:ERCC4-related helicase